MRIESAAAASATERHRAVERTVTSSGNSPARSTAPGEHARIARRSEAVGSTSGSPARSAMPRSARSSALARVRDAKTTIALGWVRRTMRASERRTPTGFVLRIQPRPRTSKGSTAAQTCEPWERRTRSTRGSRRGGVCSSIGRVMEKSETLRAGVPGEQSRSTRHGCGGSARWGPRAYGPGRSRRDRAGCRP